MQGRQKAAGKKGKVREADTKPEAFAKLQKDTNLSAFHALGKLLYNKREGVDPTDGSLSQEAASQRQSQESATPSTVDLSQRYVA